MVLAIQMKIDDHELSKLKERLTPKAGENIQQAIEKARKRGMHYANMLLHRHGVSIKTHSILFSTGEIVPKKQEEQKTE